MINKKTIGKIASAIGILAATSAYADYTPKASIPSTRIDDGRPSLARVYDDEKWYLHIPIIPYVNFNNLMMFGDLFDIIKKIPRLEYPSGEILDDPEGFQDFENQIKDLPATSGTITIDEKLSFGVFTKYLELHFFGGGEGRADFKLNDYQGYKNIEFEGEKVIVQYDKAQDIFIGAAYGDIIAGGRFVVPIRIGNKFTLKPSVGAGYRHREAAFGFVSLEQMIVSDENIHHSDIDKTRSYGDGWFLNTSLLADFSKLERYTRPVVAVGVENLYSYMDYKQNYMGMDEHDPVRLNFGFQLTPMGWFDIRTDFLNIVYDPEYRVEIAKTLPWGEFALFGRLHEKTLLGDYRHSVNVYAGFGNKIVRFGLCGSYDSMNKFGAGIVLSIGYNPNRKQF